ncbi:MAG: hypothetical protein XE04_0051 [Marinimicrobia bacterium 46_43]|nr:MAG: hypothetical protein XE04_0051 [Marinimicrobia bacterium 46_43]HBY17911.1 hypothetical protein [Candidatus Neomarinimicrobiota bacterium]
MKATHRFVALFTILIIFLPSCTSIMTNTAIYKGMDEAIANNRFSVPIAQLEKVKDKAFSDKDRVLYYLNMGMLHHYNGNYSESNAMLTQAERGIEELFTASVSKIATSFLLNDNAVDYAGEDYEDIYLNVFKALNYAHLGETDASFVELNRLHHKLQQLETKYVDMSAKYQQAMMMQIKEEVGDETEGKVPEFKPGTLRYHNSALGNALGVILYRYENDYDDARIDKQNMLQAFSSQPHIYPFDPPDISIRPESRDKIPVTLLSFHGLGPIKDAANFRITTFDDYVVISSDYSPVPFSETIPWPSKKGYHFKFSLPYLKERSSLIHSVKVRIDNNQTLTLTPLEDMNKVAVTTFELKAPLIYLKSVARSLIKGFAAEKGKEKMNDEIENPYLSLLAGFATDVTLDVSENADLRLSRFFPGFTTIADFELSPGEHRLEVLYLDQYGNIIRINDLGTVRVNPRGLNLYESFCLQ